MNAPLPVTVTRNALTIRNCPPELADMLVFIRQGLLFQHDQLQQTPERVSYAQYETPTKICHTYPNALHLVERGAGRLGLKLEVNDQRLRPPLAPPPLEAAEPLLEMVARTASSGLLIVSAERRSAILQGLVRMLPAHFKVLITTDDPATASQIHATLSQACPEEKIGLHNGAGFVRGRIMVTPLEALKDFVQGDLAHSGYGLRDFDAWICDEAHRLPSPGRLSFLSQFRPVYAWGLTATPHRTDNSHQLLAVVFGPTLGQDSQGFVDAQSFNSPEERVPAQVYIFPLPTPTAVPEHLPVHTQVRLAYLNNPALGATLRGIDANLPPTAKVAVLVDSKRLGVCLRKQLPHYALMHRRPRCKRETPALPDRVLIVGAASPPMALPANAYVIDCRLAANWVAADAREGSAIERRPGQILFLCLGSERFFNEGIARLQQINALGWQVNYMFGRELGARLPFEHAPLLPELGTFANE